MKEDSFYCSRITAACAPWEIKVLVETCRNTGSSKSLVFNAYLVGTKQAPCVRHNAALICSFSAEVQWIIKHK